MSASPTTDRPERLQVLLSGFPESRKQEVAESLAGAAPLTVKSVLDYMPNAEFYQRNGLAAVNLEKKAIADSTVVIINLDENTSEVVCHMMFATGVGTRLVLCVSKDWPLGGWVMAHCTAVLNSLEEAVSYARQFIEVGG